MEERVAVKSGVTRVLVTGGLHGAAVGGVKNGRRLWNWKDRRAER